MTPGVNLLPIHYVERIADRRRVAATVAALLLLVAALALIASDQSRELQRAEKERDTEQARYEELRARQVKLVPFRELADRILGRERLLAAAMQTEVSWANVLDSLSSVFPADASLTSLSAESKVMPFGSVPAVEPRNEVAVIGSTALKGYSIQRFTPGLDRALRLLATVTGLSEPRLQVGAVNQIGDASVTTFEGTTFIDGTALTRRYADGLPPEDDVKVPVAGAGGPAAAANGGSPLPATGPRTPE